MNQIHIDKSGKEYFRFILKVKGLRLNPKVNHYINTELKKFNNLFIKQNNIITLSQIFKLHHSPVLKRIAFKYAIRKKTRNHPPFIQDLDATNKEFFDNGISTGGFLTDADIANDLDISYTKAKRMLSPKSHLKTTPKIRKTEKLWHVKDNINKHFRFIKNKNKRIDKYHKYTPATKGYICGKNKPKIVVSVDDYLQFIKNYYDPKYTDKSQRKHILSKYKRDVFKRCHDMRYTNYELMMKLAKAKEELTIYKKTLYSTHPYYITYKTSKDFMNGLYELKNKLFNSPIPNRFTRPKYPEYQSQSHLLNQINKKNYLEWKKLYSYAGGKKSAFKLLNKMRNTYIKQLNNNRNNK